MHDDWLVKRGYRLTVGDTVCPLTLLAAGGVRHTPKDGVVVTVTNSQVEVEDDAKRRWYAIDTVFAVRPVEHQAQ